MKVIILSVDTEDPQMHILHARLFTQFETGFFNGSFSFSIFRKRLAGGLFRNQISYRTILRLRTRFYKELTAHFSCSFKRFNDVKNIFLLLIRRGATRNRVSIPGKVHKYISRRNL